MSQGKTSNKKGSVDGHDEVKKGTSARKGSTSKTENNSVCIRCKSDVKSSDKGVECEICGLWYHVQCEGMSIEQYQLMLKEECKNLHWFCNDCESVTLSTGKMIHSLKNRQDAVEAELLKLNKKINKSVQDTEREFDVVKAAILDIETILSNYKDKLTIAEATALIDCKINVCKGQLVEETKKEIPSLWSDMVSKSVDSKLAKVSTDVEKVNKVAADTRKIVEEEKDREGRANNIILYRVPESDKQEESVKHDKDFCCSLANEALDLDMNSDDIKSLFRLGKKGASCRPLLVQFRERSVKNRIMESLFKLKDADDKFKNISLTHDLTKQERVDCKSLVEEAKKKQKEEKGEFLWRVRGLPGQMKVIRIQKK
jgi:hypothetical protein